MVKVIVAGLKPEEHMFKESLEELCSATGKKLENFIQFSPEDELHLQVKSHVEGKKKRFEINIRLSAGGKVYVVKEPDKDTGQHHSVWDLNLIVREALAELKTVVEKNARPKHPKGLGEDEVLAKRGKTQL